MLNPVKRKKKKMRPPEWAVKFRRPGTELRRVNETRYKLYECSCVYDKQRKRPRKITGKYLGSITEAGGFKESRKRQLERELEELRSGKSAAAPAPRVGSTCECGLSVYLLDSQAESLGALKEAFPLEWERIAALAYCRLRDQSPMRRVLADFSDGLMSERLGTRGLSANALSAFLREVGGRRAAMTSYMRGFVRPDDTVIFDGTDQISASRLMGYPQLTKTKRGTFDRAVNIMWMFSCGRHLPVYYRLLPGGVKDVSAFKLCAREAGASGCVAIVDKGFQSASNMEALDRLGIKYVMALKRNTTGLDYSPFETRDNAGADGVFIYHERPVWWKRQHIGGREVILYLDEKRRGEETEDYMRRVLDPKAENYTIETFRAKSLQMGTLALLNASGDDPEKTYLNYKTRGDVEQAIDAFKNIVEADHSYMQDEKSLEAWMFVNLIALQWYYSIAMRLKQAGLASKYSPMDMVHSLSRMRAVQIDGQWVAAEVSKQERPLVKAAGLHITPNEGIL